MSNDREEEGRRAAAAHHLIMSRWFGRSNDEKGQEKETTIQFHNHYHYVLPPT
jgi:hypothetical protein